MIKLSLVLNIIFFITLFFFVLIGLNLKSKIEEQRLLNDTYFSMIEDYTKDVNDSTRFSYEIRIKELRDSLENCDGQ